jgi:NAD(P)-dependent dehydrogenase (short-subunit alcohol dehydrogenase family)
MGFGKHTRAEEVVSGISLKGKTAIVTGASSGIGVETARALAKAGADLVFAVRSESAGNAVADDIRRDLPNAAIDVRLLDLTDLDSVRAFAEGFARPTIDLLINNAGVMATPRGTTKQGIELQVGTNHVGHFLLTKLLEKKLAPDARVVNVSSSFHKRGRGARLIGTLTEDPRYEKRRYAPFDAYADSKLANVLFTRSLAKRLKQPCFSLHPGVIKTNLTRSMGALGAVFRAVGGLFMKSIPQGAATTVYAAVSPELAGETGAYLEDCHVSRASREAADDALADRLWEISEKLVS